MENTLFRLVKNSFFLTSSRALDFCMVIFTTPFIARYLGLKAFGDYALITAFTIIIASILEFGTENIMSRDISKDKNNASMYINSIVIIRAIFFTPLLLIYYILIKLLVLDNVFGQAILISVYTEFIISLSMVFFSVIRAYERMEYELFSNFFNKIFFIIAVLNIVFFDYGFLALFYARLFSSLVLLLLALFFVFKKLVVFKKRYSFQLAVSVLKQGFPVALAMLFIVASSKVDIYFLKYFKGSVEIALFEAPNRLIVQLQFIPFSVATSLIPFFSRLSTNTGPLLKNHCETVVKFLFIFSIFAVMLMYTGAEIIITTLFGSKFLPSALSFKIITWIFIFFSLNYFLHQILIIIGKQKMFSIFAWVSFLVNVILDLLLIPYYGYLGASWATLASCLNLFIFTLLYISKEIGKMNIIEVFVKPSFCITLSWIIIYFLYTNTIISFIISSFISLFIYISLLLLSHAFSKIEIEFFEDLILKKKSRELAKDC